MNYYDALKSKANILQIANELGFSGTRSGSCLQGTCPRHGSSSGKCLSIWPRTQSFNCFHCGEGGDVINLVQLYRRCDHVTAVNFLADKAGMPRLHAETLSPEDQARLQAEHEERTLVEDMLTESGNFYHSQLEKYPDIREHLENHYGFSPELVAEQLIGYAPHDQENPLAEHLQGIERFKDKLHLCGLFIVYSGTIQDSFMGRIIFPYWKNGKIVYMAARATAHTPVTPYECYTNADGEIKRDARGNPEYIKYKKLRTHDPDNTSRQYISRFIQNDTFIGEDTARGAKEIIITEGIPDVLSAIDHGFAAISPATTSFRESDHEKLLELTRYADAIYIINDNEKNRAGEIGALKTGKRLAAVGKNVFLVELPRPEGRDKIDLNEYLKENKAAVLRKLMDESKTVIERLIDELPENPIRAIPDIKQEIAPLLKGFDPAIRECYADLIKRKTNLNQKALTGLLTQVWNEHGAEGDGEKLSPEMEKKALALAHDPLVFIRRINTVNEIGIVGERTNIAMYFAAMDSRLLMGEMGKSNVLSVKNSGHSGSGKSSVLDMCIKLYCTSGYHFITGGSPKSLYHMPDGLKHKALIIAEAFSLQQNRGDNELVYAIRSLLSEGRIRYQVTEKDADERLTTVTKCIEGPTALITTTIMEKLEPQLEDRLCTIHSDESLEQTRAIIIMTGKAAAGQVNIINDPDIAEWRAFHSLLKPVRVIIPFAARISDHITGDAKLPIATRRAYNKILIMVQAVTCCYQYQRKRDAQGRVLAEMADYWTALQIVSKAFAENMGKRSENTEEKIKFIQGNSLVKPKALVSQFAVSSAAISQWVKGMVADGVLVWCDESGNAFADERDEAKAKKTGKAFLKILTSTRKLIPLACPPPSS